MTEKTIQPDVVDGDRGIPSVNARNTNTKGKKTMAALYTVAALGLGGMMIYATMKNDKAEIAEEDKGSVVAPSETRKFDTPPPPAPPATPPGLTEQEAAMAIAMANDPNLMPPPPPGLDGQAYGQPAPAPAPTTEPKPRPRLDKGMSELMAASSTGDTTGTTLPVALGLSESESGAQGDTEGGIAGALTSLLQSTQTGRVSAGRLGHRNMTIAKGAMIDCVLQTRIVSTHPGMTSCVTTRDIYSDNGKVLLLERGSLVTGEYQSGIQQGQARLFVLWNRVKTPNGVTINIDSPGTDPLGGSGLPGKVNNHFFQRFGSALLLSMIEAGLDRVAQSDSSGNNYYGSAAERSRRLSERTLDANINIPPTLYKNQGERINIFVARDLYFGDVYGLRVYERGAAP